MMKTQVQTGAIYALMFAGVALLVLLLYKLMAIIIIVLIAMVITTGIDPLVNAIQRIDIRGRHLPRGVAVMMVLVCGMCVVGGAISLLVFTALREILDFVSVWQSKQDIVIKWVTDMQRQYTFIPSNEDIMQWISAQSERILGYLAASSWAVIGLVGGLFSMLILFFMTFFFSMAKDGICYMILQLIPPQYQSRVREVGHMAALKMGGWLRGQFLLAMIIAVTTMLGMWALGVRYPVVVGIMAGLGELIPMVGPVAGFVPAILLVLIFDRSAVPLIGVPLFFIALTQAENYILSPKVMEKQVGIAPVTTILAILTGGTLFGIVGALLAIPIAAASRVIMLEMVMPAIQKKTRQQIEEGNPGGSKRSSNEGETVTKPPAKRRRRKAEAS